MTTPEQTHLAAVKALNAAAHAARSDDSIRIDMSNFAEDYRTATVYLEHDWESVSDDAVRGGQYLRTCTATVIGVVIDDTVPEVLTAEQAEAFFGPQAIMHWQSASAEIAEAV